jgi:hypothetical protein
MKGKRRGRRDGEGREWVTEEGGIGMNGGGKEERNVREREGGREEGIKGEGERERRR